jgi:hypothetical protein
VWRLNHGFNSRPFQAVSRPENVIGARRFSLLAIMHKEIVRRVLAFAELDGGAWAKPRP